jgi:hypothetical protein
MNEIADGVSLAVSQVSPNGRLHGLHLGKERALHMRIFTFSGMRGGFNGTNCGEEIIQFARDMANALPKADAPVYEGIKGQDHFISEINWRKLLGELGPATLLDGSPVLNDEASKVAPVAAEALLKAVAPSAEEHVMIIAHSQGTNNATFTLRHLLSNHPEFFINRPVRCLFLDPKVGPNHVHDVFAMSSEKDLPFLFLQSEQDLLSNQGVFGTQFIDQFPLGNHIFVAAISHNDIADWQILNRAKLRWLTRSEYRDKYVRAIEKERIRLRQRRGKPGWSTFDEQKLAKFKRAYRMKTGALTQAVLQFGRGLLAERFQS